MHETRIFCSNSILFFSFFSFSKPPKFKLKKTLHSKIQLHENEGGNCEAQASSNFRFNHKLWCFALMPFSLSLNLSLCAQFCFHWLQDQILLQVQEVSELWAFFLFVNPLEIFIQWGVFCKESILLSQKNFPHQHTPPVHCHSCDLCYRLGCVPTRRNIQLSKRELVFLFGCFVMWDNQTLFRFPCLWQLQFHQKQNEIEATL